MAITVKKKKTLKLKSDAPGAPDDQSVAEEPESVLAAMRGPADSAPVKSGGSFVPYVIMALIACGLLGAVIAMQFIENSYYKGMVP
ncbi:MAG: hypothetical protein QGH42_02275 [Kiritimatiellia bacterium]|nr:hypothetical protein [Kiritimatiellia bacterium]MDP6629618.1 hypothetical protein [Kiritimatiellia bacterium]MDP6809325.1 hypothetical protein [Kiritimatiellia bacterium]MDP7023064.1 hypothetical protein [Kiritimatiellia bacterium]